MESRNRPSGLISGVVLALSLLSPPALAGTLEGRTVTFTVMTWDDPAAPFLEARGRTVTVGEGVEFGLEPEGLIGGLDVVPVKVEIGANRIELEYPKGFGQFYKAGFNGYVLRFAGDCALFTDIRIDPAFTTMAITAADIFTDKGALYINTSDRLYGSDIRIGLDLDVADCPMS